MPTPDEQSVTALYERWVKVGPPPLGVSLARWWDRRLIELHDAIGHRNTPAVPEWTPPPPGDRREQLPDHLLALIQPYLLGYTSTACQTAGYLTRALADHPEVEAELVEWQQRMGARCRRNQKYTGEICPHHTQPEEPSCISALPPQPSPKPSPTDATPTA